MQRNLSSEIEKYTKQNNRQSTWKKIVRVLSCIVVFCTTYALILPAITMEKTTACKLTEHVHTETCYVQVVEEQQGCLTCTYETLGIHRHIPECYDSENVLQCGMADYIVHTHDASCADAEGKLVCELPEVAVHEHIANKCYLEVKTSHIHKDACYIEEKGDLLCGLDETDGHTHTEACYIAGDLKCELACMPGPNRQKNCEMGGVLVAFNNFLFGLLMLFLLCIK